MTLTSALDRFRSGNQTPDSRTIAFTSARVFSTTATVMGEKNFQENKNTPTILFLHGFKGFRQWGFIPVVAHCFALSGYRFVAINFSHNGIEGDSQDISNLDKFRDNTFSLELEEVHEWINVITGGIPGHLLPSASLGIMGHSRGGALSLLAGCSHPKVKAICTWAAVSFFNRYPPEIIQQWQADGVIYTENKRTGQQLPLGWNLHADLMQHLNGKLSIRKSLENNLHPLCVIHGENDEAIPFADAENIVNWVTPGSCVLHKIAATGHTFGVSHPMQLNSSWPQAFEEALTHSLDFFHSQLPLNA